MKFQFSEDLWEQISSLGHQEKSGDTIEPDYSDEQVRNLMRMWFLGKRALREEGKQEYQVLRAWRKVGNRIRLRDQRRLVSVFRYAAVVIGVVGIAALWLSRTDRSTDLPLSASASIPSGYRKAELTLASGEKIVLDTNLYQEKIRVAGMDFLNDDQRGELSYKGSSDENVDDSQLGYHTLYVPKGGEYSLQLPDGSRVWLNSETTLRFPVRFLEKQREVFLCGEAYFDVVKNDLSPFRVKVSEGTVTVLGTCFNISAYEEDGIWQTTLVEGSVSLEDGREKVLLRPAGQYSVNWHTGERILKSVDPELYTSWIGGKFYFSAYAFEEIVKKLERWYDFTMTYQDEEIRRMHFSGTINKHRPLNEVLHFLERTADIHFEMSGKHVTVRKIQKG